MAFNYVNVPYSKKPNLMFNKAAAWSHFIEETIGEIVSRLPVDATVVEIGHGDGGFLTSVAERLPQGRCVGFDPHGAAEGSGSVSFRTELFEPMRHLSELKPDIVISRHVLEHLINPLGFLQMLSFAATLLRQEPMAYFEVPCIDKAIGNQRTVDFYYEHSSQFTTNSFSRMLAEASAEIINMGHGYDGEVVFAHARVGIARSESRFVEESMNFRKQADSGISTISEQLATLHTEGHRVAIWGGTGKSAAFMCRFNVDAKRFPIVVESDRAKVGTYVPGTGQEIKFRDWLKENPVDIIIIPPQWRAADISLEIRNTGIIVDKILIEHRGSLIEFVA